MTCLPPPPVAAAASAEPSLLPPPSSRPRRSTSEVQRRPQRLRQSSLGASARRKARAALLPTCPLRHPAAADHHARALAGAQNAMCAGQLPLIINWISLCRSRSPCSTAVRPHSHPRSLSTSTTLIHLSRGVRCAKTHEYCELFMIIRSLSIQSHDKLGTPVFKLMIIFVCCIQTQLIIFMPHAGVRRRTRGGRHGHVAAWEQAGRP